MSQSLHHDLLSHHISLSSSSNLCLVTSVLGASGSWYSHSLLAALLKSSSTVIHLSFLHNAVFHSDAVRKWGVDLGQYGRKGRYVFVDGLSGLFLPGGTKDGVSMQAGLEKMSQQVKERIQKAVATAGSGKVVLLVEGPDVLLSVGGVSSMELVNELLDWHELVSSTTVMVNADTAFVTRTKTRLEMEEASFVTTLAHQAASVTSLRMLDTGLAKDVSGVLRVTTSSETANTDWREKEVLYFVKDGSVEVFNRGQ
ncbi:hypothetical protein BZA77DRAFT_270521, partial [Pyronema omphalodes]